MSSVRVITLNNGRTIPILGFGTWQATKEECQQSLRAALDAGYRHFDTASAYGNEEDIGQVLKEYIDDGKVTREELFITTKLWVTYHEPERVMECLDLSLKKLQLNYVDLYLIHTPCAFKETGRPFGSEDFLDIPVEETWKGMEKAVLQHKAISIGVSNFNSKQVDRICQSCNIKPVTNQVECHPYLSQRQLHDFCKARSIILTSYGSIGSPGRPDRMKRPNEPVLLEDPLVTRLADKYQKTPGQILLRYLTQRNIIVIPKSINPERIRSNIQIFDFYLNDEEVEDLNNLDRGFRYFDMDVGKGHPEYPGDEPF